MVRVIDIKETVARMKLCSICGETAAALKRPSTGRTVCKECFYSSFENEIHETIVSNNLFEKGEKVAIGASGGKDSTVLAHVLTTLNKKYNYGVEFVLLSVDEGIKGYRDDSLETVKRNQYQYDLPLKIVSYKDLYGYSMDDIVKIIGRRNNCTYCGVFRRQALDRGADLLGIKHIVTGHNGDDLAETILMNLLRGDIARLSRCTQIVTTSSDSPIKRSKPFKYASEKEIVLYAHYKKLDYFSTECTYSTEAFRGTVRTLIKDMEYLDPRTIQDVIHSGESFCTPDALRESVKGALPQQKRCTKCNYISSNDICKACALLGNLAKLEITTDSS